MKFNSQLLLRLGLAFVFLYAGVSIFLEPISWIGFVPSWIENFGLSRTVALYAHALGDIFVGFWLLSGRLRFWAGISSFLFLFLIIVLNGTPLLLITFRDIGLAFSALAYAFWENN